MKKTLSIREATIAGAYSTRKAYDWTAVSSIYIDKDYRRCGAGRLLYKEVARFKKDGKKFDRWYDLVWFQKRF